MFFVILPSFFTCNLWKYGISVKIEDILLFRAEYEAFPELSGGNSGRVPYISGFYGHL